LLTPLQGECYIAIADFAAPWAEVPVDSEGQRTQWIPNPSVPYTFSMVEEIRESFSAVERERRQASVQCR